MNSQILSLSLKLEERLLTSVPLVIRKCNLKLQRDSVTHSLEEAI